VLKDITMGQFFPGNSPLHRMDPRVKLVLLLCYIVILFLIHSPLSYAVMIVFLALVIASSKIAPKLIFKGMKPILFIIVFTAVLNLFCTSGQVVWHLGFLHITKEGISLAIKMVLRITLLVTSSSMLTYTTSPIMLTDGIESLLSPCKRFHFPVHEMAMMMSIALRFIPTLIEETEKIMNAQKARGADFESGSLLQRAKAMVPILIPLFISAFRRADELATAMECRLYRGDVGRTRLRQFTVTKVDYIACILTAAVLTAAMLV
jgi:energy-coupling factor transport system permease protein